MKRYLLKLGLFVLILSVVLGLIFMGIESTKSRAMSLPKDIHTVYIGNSMVETAVDDEKLPGTFNFARSSEHIEYVYSKIKMLADNNPQLDTIFIGLDNIILFKDFVNSNNIMQNHPYLFSEWSVEDIRTLVKNTAFPYYTTYLSHPLEIAKLRFLVRVHGPKDTQLGGYKFLERDKLAENLRLLKEDPLHPNSIDSVNPLTVYFFNKIGEECKKRNIEMILFATPKHPSVQSDKAYVDFKKRYLMDYSFYDFSSMALPDSCFGDCFHLNYRGAKVFTDSLKDNKLNPKYLVD